MKLLSVLGVAYEDDDLVEFKIIEQLNQLLDLLVVFQFDVVLLETMKGQF